jgi:eukaryotic-like serine/threonine-protein kinase
MNPATDETAALPPANESDLTVASGEARALVPPGTPEVPGYDVLGELGRGGMGVVYRAKQKGLNRVVALKMLPGGAYADQHELARFFGEAEVVAAVRHPNVIQVYEYGQHDSRPFLSMEFLPGGSLADFLRAKGKLDSRAAAELVEKVALGVGAAHDNGIVHRDIKPGNVLLDECAEPKVTDFGLAKRGGRDDLTRTGAVMGTPNYMAPEQAAGRTKFVGPAADIYALGVILYECLTGRVPFAAADTMKLLAMVVDDEPPSVRELAPAVPRDLEAICLKCLKKDPRDRYASAHDLAADLQRFQSGEAVAARSTGVFGLVAGALEREGKDIEFTGYANVLFGFAALTLVADGLYTAISLKHLSLWWGVGIQWTRVILMAALVAVARKGRVLPRTATERQLWSIGCGYAVACLFGSLALRMSHGWPNDGSLEPLMYQLFAVLGALAFFALGSVFSGRCYAFGVAFLLLACAMSAAMEYSPLMFGLVWAGVLTLFGCRLQTLARKQAREAAK